MSMTVFQAFPQSLRYSQCGARVLASVETVIYIHGVRWILKSGGGGAAAPQLRTPCLHIIAKSIRNVRCELLCIFYSVYTVYC